MEKVFVDTDIVLDLLARRQPFYPHAAELFSRADKGELQLYLSSLTFVNVHYLLRRALGEVETRQALIRLKALAKTLEVDAKIIELALSSDFKDFEDAVQYHCATEKGVAVLLTRNLRDYKHARIPVMTAEMYVKGEP